jgi:hypothetical protein
VELARIANPPGGQRRTLSDAACLADARPIKREGGRLRNTLGGAPGPLVPLQATFVSRRDSTPRSTASQPHNARPRCWPAACLTACLTVSRYKTLNQPGAPQRRPRVERRRAGQIGSSAPVRAACAADFHYLRTRRVPRRVAPVARGTGWLPGRGSGIGLRGCDQAGAPAPARHSLTGSRDACSSR